MEKKTALPVGFSADDMGIAPARWVDRGIDASHVLFLWWGYILREGANPVLVMRSLRGGVLAPDDKAAAGNLRHFELVPGMFGQPKPLDLNPLLDGDLVARYREVARLDGDAACCAEGDPVYEASFERDGEVRMLYRAGNAGCRAQEGDFLDVRGENMPWALSIDPPGIYGPYFTWNAIYRGTYYGEEVEFSGGADRFFSAAAFADLVNHDNYYFANIVSGVAEDGTREYGCLYVVNGRTVAWYAKDGCEPKCSEDVKVEAKWVCDPNDPRQIAPEELTWSFDDVEVHWKAEYTVLYKADIPNNHFGGWYEKNGCRKFKHYLGAVESNVKPKHVDSVSAYER